MWKITGKKGMSVFQLARLIFFITSWARNELLLNQNTTLSKPTAFFLTSAKKHDPPCHGVGLRIPLWIFLRRDGSHHKEVSSYDPVQEDPKHEQNQPCQDVWPFFIFHWIAKLQHEKVIHKRKNPRLKWRQSCQRAMGQVNTEVTYAQSKSIEKKFLNKVLRNSARWHSLLSFLPLEIYLSN